jgi:hypothetical protein
MFNPRWLWAVAIVLTAFASLMLVAPITSLPFHVARNFNEGWNAYWAITAISGGHLYPPMSALVSNNYPPLSFFVLGFLGRAPADPILAGRILALASMLLVTINIVAWLSRNGVRASLALVSGAAFIITMDALAPAYIAQNDPQWFAHALMTTGMIVLWRNPRSAARLASAAIMVMLGGWVKQLLIPLPVALTVWLYSNNRRAFWQWLALLSVLGLLLFAVTFAAYGHNVIDGILWAPRRLSIKRPFMVAKTALAPLIPFLCFAAVLVRRYRASSTVTFVLNFLAIAIAVAALATTGEGVWANAAFDAAIAGCLATGLALEDITTTLSMDRARHSFLLGASVVAGLIFAFWAVSALHLNIGRLRGLPAKIEATNADIEFLRQHDARGAACQGLALCFWAGAPFNLDFFNFGQKLMTGQIPIKVCSRLFDGTQYTIIHSYSAPTAPDVLLPPACIRDIAEHYQLVRTSLNGFFLTPRSQPTVSRTGSQNLLAN